MPISSTAFSLKFQSSYGVHIVDHLAADGAGFTGSQVTVVTIGRVHAYFLGSLPAGCTAQIVQNGSCLNYTGQTLAMEPGETILAILN